MNEKRRACAPYQFFGTLWTASGTGQNAAHSSGYVRGYPMDLASLAARLLPGATGSTCIFMRRHPRDERPHMPLRACCNGSQPGASRSSATARRPPLPRCCIGRTRLIHAG
jgi:hypothetical protein